MVLEREEEEGWRRLVCDGSLRAAKDSGSDSFRFCIGSRFPSQFTDSL